MINVALLSLLIVAATSINAVICLKNFDHGLKSAIQNASRRTINRMTIEEQ